MKVGKKLTVALSIAAALVVSGGGGAAVAATAYTSISGWDVSWSGSWRAASSSTIAQKFDFTSTCYWARSGAPTPEYAQMQLQRQNGIFAPISEGNRNVGCASSAGAQSWGARVGGINYRYQYNGAKIPGITGLQGGLFSNSGVTITY